MYRISDFWSRGPGQTDTGSLNLRRSNIGRNTGLANRVMKRLSGGRFSDANYIATFTRTTSQYRYFIANQARGLAAAPIDAEEERHADVLSQGIDFAGADTGSWPVYQP